MKDLLRAAVAVALAGATLCACAETPRLVAIRMDGQSIRENPVLQQALDTDHTVCRGDAKKAALSGVTVHGGGLAGAIAQAERNGAISEVMTGCMAQKGYTLVPEQAAEHELARYRANAQMAASQGAQVLTTSSVQPRN